MSIFKLLATFNWFDCMCIVATYYFAVTCIFVVVCNLQWIPSKTMRFILWFSFCEKNNKTAEIHRQFYDICRSNFEYCFFLRSVNEYPYQRKYWQSKDTTMIWWKKWKTKICKIIVSPFHSWITNFSVLLIYYIVTDKAEYKILCQMDAEDVNRCTQV